MIRRPTATDLVIFGASGDLARRKIIPALQSLNGNVGRLRVLGAGRSAMSREQFQDIVAEATKSRDLAAGADSAVIWANDLTAEYVHENSAYSS